MDPTLHEARETVKEGLEKGTICPTCDQLARQYKRKLNAGMARALVALYRAGNGKAVWLHGETIIRAKKNISHDWVGLHYWDLIEARPNHDTTKRHSGWWRLTNDGLRFARNETFLPSHVFIYNGKRVGWTKIPIDIAHAFSDPFSYKELMQNGGS